MVVKTISYTIYKRQHTIVVMPAYL